MERVRSFRDLIAWQVAMDLATGAYRLTESFPDGERYGLVSQIRRAAVSIPANVAEGHRRSLAGYCHHVIIALGSHAELETLLELSARLSYLDSKEAESLFREAALLGRLLNGLARKLRRRLKSGGAPDP